jgi:predicted RecA/RadA family phage recombinase
MKNFIQDGDVLTVRPTVSVASGGGYSTNNFFGVAANAVDANTDGEFRTEGVYELKKQGSVAIAMGVRVFWDQANGWVTPNVAAGLLCIGYASEAAVGTGSTVRVRLSPVLALGT